MSRARLWATWGAGWPQGPVSASAARRVYLFFMLRGRERREP